MALAYQMLATAHNIQFQHRTIHTRSRSSNLSQMSVSSHICGRNTTIKTFLRKIHFHPTIKEIKEKCKIGDTVTAKGWVRHVRKQKPTSFVDISDGSCLSPLQSVLSLEQLKEFGITYGSCVEVSGQLVESPGLKQQMELQITHATVIGQGNENSNPLQPKRHSYEFLREIAYLRPRATFFGSIMRIRNASSVAINNFFQKEGFIHVHTPILTASDAEGAGEMFTVSNISQHKAVQTAKTSILQNSPPLTEGEEDDGTEFFNESVMLTVSGQLQAEMFACAMNRVYTFGPTFRAERSHTQHHLAEFWMLEPEMAFADLNLNMEVSEAMVKYVVKHLLENCEEDLRYLNEQMDKTLVDRLKRILNKEFVRITYEEALSILDRVKDDQGFKYPTSYGSDIKREHERYLADVHFNQTPVFVINWPKEIKAFYMRQNDDGRTVAAMDLLVPGVGELIGGSAREERYDVLKQVMDSKKINKNGNLDWYLNLRKFGTCPHAGFGLGFERFIQFVTGTSNIKDTIPVPRYRGYCKF